MTTITSHYGRRPRLDRAAVRIGTLLVAWGRRAESRTELRTELRAEGTLAAASRRRQAVYVEAGRDSAAYARQQLLP